MSAIVLGHIAAAGPRCGACWYDLAGLPRRGRCPECGRAYDQDAEAQEAARVERMRARRVPPGRVMIEALDRWRPTLWTVAVVLLVLGSASVAIVFGVMAAKKLAYLVDPPMGCGGGGGGFPL